MDTSTGQNPQRRIKRMRWTGLFMSIAGVALGYLCVISPLLSAARHEEDVSISAKCVVLAPALVVIGLSLVFMGNEGAGQVFGSRQKPTALGLVLCIVLAGVGILLYEWLKSRIRAYGYSL